MKKGFFRKLKPLDRILLVMGFLFAALLLAALVVPGLVPAYADIGSLLTQPLGGAAFLLLGIYALRNLRQPQKNLGFFLIAASAFSFIVSAVAIIKSVA